MIAYHKRAWAARNGSYGEKLAVQLDLIAKKVQSGAATQLQLAEQAGSNALRQAPKNTLHCVCHRQLSWVLLLGRHESSLLSNPAAIPLSGM